MRKYFRSFAALVLVAVTVFSMTVPAAAAASPGDASPQASAYITAVWATSSGGSHSITVDFSITATGKMTSLGSTMVEIKNTSGTTVKLFKATDTPSMMGSNQTFYRSSVTWDSATSGSKYYALVYFKAANSSGSDTTSYTTSFATAK